MNRNAISRLIEVSVVAGIAIAVVGAGSVGAQDKATAAKPVAAASKNANGPTAVPASRQKVATQKLMRNPWERTVEMASSDTRPSEERLYLYW